MSTKISLILIALLTLLVTACSPTVAKDPTPVASTNQESIAIIPVTGENVSDTSSKEAPSANASMYEKQVQQGVCVLDAGQPRHVGGCVDFYNPNINADQKAPSAVCIPDDDLTHHRSTCLE